MTKNKQVILFWMPVIGGFHISAWRQDDAPSDPVGIGPLRRMVEAAERAKLHGCFIADGLAIGSQELGLTADGLSHTSKALRIEPLTVLSALSWCTERIGLLATASTTYCEPYHVARMFGSLDHLSGGRAGWNVVTSVGGREAANFGIEQHMDHAARYARAQEFFDIVAGLWDSWEDDAFPMDRESGVYFDLEKMHMLNYQGKYLSAAGPLNGPRPPQGHPVIAQAGSSGPGLAFAARNADVVYTLQAGVDRGKVFYEEIKDKAAEFGRDPEHVKVLPALKLLVGRTQADADEKFARLQQRTDPVVGMQALAGLIEADLSGVALDGPVPDIPETEHGVKTRQKYYLDLAKRDNLTVRQLMHIAVSHDTITGTPTDVADLIQEWVEAGAADGVNITFSDAADSFDVFVEHVVPELQRRGVFQTEYRGKTLRDSLGLPRPANQFTAVPH